MLRKKTKLIEVPTEEIWTLDVDPENNIGIRKFDVCTQGHVSSTYEGKPLPLLRMPITSQVVTRLDGFENVMSNYVAGKTHQPTGPAASTNAPANRTTTQQHLQQAVNSVEVSRGITFGDEVEVSKDINFADESAKLSDEAQKKSESPEFVKVSIIENDGDVNLEGDDIDFRSRDAAFDRMAQDAFEANMAEHDLDNDGHDGIDDYDDGQEEDEAKFLNNELDREFQRNQVGTQTGDSTLTQLSDKFSSEALSDKVSYGAVIVDLNKIRDLAQRIENTAQIKIREGSLSVSDYKDLMASLEQVQLDLDGTIQILEN